MITLLRKILRRKPPAQNGQMLKKDVDSLPEQITLGDGVVFPIARHISAHEGYPVVDWVAVQSWVSEVEAELQEQAWSAAERAWLLYMKAHLGLHFDLTESSNAILLSSLEANVANATLEYMERTLQRVMLVLDGIAQLPFFGKEILIVFDDDESYYQYVSCYYPKAGEYASSGGMHIDAGCSHYATVKSDLRLIEPIIAHEMTHGCLGHLPLPAWLNEGLAVNVERRLTSTSSIYTPQQVCAKHRTFWREDEVQEFWSGQSFLHADDGNLLSYDLACLMVEQLSLSWEPFKRFVLDADRADAGAAAALRHLGVDLGGMVAALLDERESSAVDLRPDPAKWQTGQNDLLNSRSAHI